MLKLFKNFFTRSLAIPALLLVLQTLAPASANAQGGGVSGVVKDALGPVIGASVIINDSTVGTTTDLDGQFTLPNVKQGEVISISFVGYKTQEIAYTGQSFLEVMLEEDTAQLDAVVVTALGIKREEKALSYNVQQVGGDALTTVKDANFINSLAGKVAGVTINSSSAGAGAAARVVMRGTKSLEKDDNALYVIDGVPMFNINSGDTDGGTMVLQPGTNSVADINPEDIESMTILTGPSAAALYGSEAANGVVLITTKKGSEGAVKVSYSNSTMFQKPLMMPRFQNTYGNADSDMQSWGARLETPSSYDPANFFNTGFTEINSVTFTTGTERNQVYASVSTTNSNGILPNNAYNRYNFTIRNTTKFAKDKLTLDAGAQYIVQDNKNMVGGGEYFNPLTSLYLFPRGENFQEVQMFERWNPSRNIMEQYWSQQFSNDLSMQNPYWIMYRMQNSLNKRRYMFNVSLKWDIADWINVAGRVRMDNSDQDSYRKYYASTNTTFTEGSDRGFYDHAKQNNRSIYADAILSINKTFCDRYSINANIGASINNQTEDSAFLNGGLEQVPNFFSYSNIKLSTAKRDETAWHDQTQSVFASVEFGYDHWLYLTLTGRNDWASQLAFTSKNSYFYPSAGLSVVFNELFDLPKAISLLKLRGSWAEVASAPQRYLTLMQYRYDQQTGQYIYPEDHYDTNLRPENTRSWEIGLNAKFFRGHLYLDATFYRSNTFNQTFRVDASASSGYKYNIIQTGNIQNQGIEAALGYNNNWGKWSFSTGLTWTLNQNKIISLANGAINPETGEPISMDYHVANNSLGVAGGPSIRLTEGGSMGDLYINQRIKQGRNGNIWIDPSTGRLSLETFDYKYVGSLLPKYNLGWTGQVAYSGLSLSWTLSARVGGLVVSDTQAVLDRYGVSETTARVRDAGGTVTLGSMTVDAKEYYRVISQAPGSYYMYDATNVRLADLSLSYDLPRKWFKNKLGVQLSLIGKNLCMIYCKAPFDPEATVAVSNNFYQGVDYFNQPSLRQVGFSVKVSF